MIQQNTSTRCSYFNLRSGKGWSDARRPLTARWEALRMSWPNTRTRFSYFDLLADAASQALPDYSGGTGHACALETSLMMHVIPESVREALIPAGGTPQSWPDPHLYAGSAVTVWRPFERIRENGVIGTPSEASPQAGAVLFAEAVRRSRDTILKIQAEYGQRSYP